MEVNQNQPKSIEAVQRCGALFLHNTTVVVDSLQFGEYWTLADTTLLNRENRIIRIERNAPAQCARNFHFVLRCFCGWSIVQFASANRDPWLVDRTMNCPPNGQRHRIVRQVKKTTFVYNRIFIR
ncbi:hypothetical protein T10_2259 [Trichinella papuae]|uniref:Uncharacterized protein n=1 Tax=Trichinella papuae TaxID=268474 RepID=A0A0V1MEC6_9BILA|nr:hypothetical protein T10_2259 [Trichinella papuae]